MTLKSICIHGGLRVNTSVDKIVSA